MKIKVQDLEVHRCYQQGESNYPEDPGKRMEMKRAVAEEEKKPVAKAKVMAEPKKRASELRVDPPVAKAKPNPVQGAKRTAEVDAKLEESTDPFKNVPETPPIGWRPVSGLPLTKEKIAKRHLEGVIRETYSVNNLEITDAEVADIAHLCTQMAAVDVMELYSPKRFTALAGKYSTNSGEGSP